MTIKSRKVGASGRAYNARGVGYKINANVGEHGYKFKLQAEIDYAALTDRQAQKVHKLIYEALGLALEDGLCYRASNVPLFDLEDVAPQGTIKGVNEL